MRGFPNHINTRADVEYLLVEYQAEMKAKLTEYLNERFAWLTVRKLNEGEQGTTDATHRVAEVKNMATGQVTERYQEEYKEAPNCTLSRLGITVAEAEGMAQG